MFINTKTQLIFPYKNSDTKLSILGMLVVLIFTSQFACAQQNTKLNIILGDVSLNKLPFVMAYEEGIYKKNGLDLTPMFTRSSVEIIRRSGIDVPEEFVLNGETDAPIRIGGASPSIVRLTTKAGSWDPIIIGSTHHKSRWHIVGRNDIRSAEQLKGKRIGYSGVGAVTHLGAISFAQAMGWDPDNDVSLMADGLAVEALQNGYIDAFVADNLHGTMAMAAGFRVIVDLADYNFPTAGSSLLADRIWLKDNREAARQFVKSTVEAVALLKNNKDAAFKTLKKWYQLRDSELLEYFYEGTLRIPEKPYPPVEGLRRVMEVYDNHEMRKYSLEHFYDDSFVRELDESGYIDSLYN
ncbi:MAG: NitT/TauT family transport system substrate-binding protein [Gammaproteobacteria bacterium]